MKHQAANEKLNSVFRQAGQWVWVYDDESTISGGGKHVLENPTDGSSRKSFTLVLKLAHCWTGPYKVLLVGPGKAPDGDLVGRNLLLLDREMKTQDASTPASQYTHARDATTRTRESEDRNFCPGR